LAAEAWLGEKSGKKENCIRKTGVIERVLLDEFICCCAY